MFKVVQGKYNISNSAQLRYRSMIQKNNFIPVWANFPTNA